MHETTKIHRRELAASRANLPMDLPSFKYLGTWDTPHRVIDFPGCQCYIEEEKTQSQRQFIHLKASAREHNRVVIVFHHQYGDRDRTLCMDDFSDTL